jgi:ubiquinone/menaquinone biosynthesis C-methylase UbiE
MRFLVFLLCGALPAQVAQTANEGYKTEQARSNVARSLGASDRDARQRPRELVAAMDLKPGMTVADVGTGVGYMLPFLSEAVGPAGKVLAEDVFPDFLEKARHRAEEAHIANVTFVKGTEKSTMLPENAVDAVLVLDVYHHFDYPKDMLASLRSALKSDGRLVIVEYHKSSEAMPGGRALQHVRLGEADAIREIEASGFRLISKHDHVPKVQWMAVFGKN